MVDLAPEVFGRPKAEAGQWASCIRVIDPIEVSLPSLSLFLFQLSFVSLSLTFLLFLSSNQSTTLDLIELDENEAAFSLAVVNFSSRGGENILVVGTAKDTLLSPRSCSSGYLRTYTFAEDGKKLELLHIVSRSPSPKSFS